MERTTYAVAQIANLPTIEQNLQRHVELVETAVQHNADYLLFPELSLTGYIRESVAAEALEQGDDRLQVFQELAIDHAITISVGVPVRVGTYFYISSLIYLPTGKCEMYVKQYLHPGEEQFYRSSVDHAPYVQVAADTIASAICFDIENDEHVKTIVTDKATVYAASIFYSENGIQAGLKRLQNIAKAYSLPVVMSNYVGTCWNTVAGGMSTIYNRTGDIVVQGSAGDECLLVGHEYAGIWEGRVVNV